MYLLGENVNIGVGVEDPADRGTPVEPTAWVAGRTPTGVQPVLDKVLIQETKGTRISSQGSEITQSRVEGDLEFNCKNNSIGYLLKSLLGAVVSSLAPGETTVYQHDFTVQLNNPQNPSLSLALSRLGQQHYQYPLAIVTQIEFNTPVDDLVNATASFIAQKEEQHPDFSRVFPLNDYYFRNHDVRIKIADTIADLDSAPAIGIKEFSLTINNNGRPNQNIQDYNPSDSLGLLFEISGSMSIDFQDETYHDIYMAGDYKAMRIEMTRNDIVIGVGENPRITIDLARISFEKLEQDRPIDDIVMDKIDFLAHFSTADSKAISIQLVNETADYDATTSGS